jgi:hypothetical protein
MTNTVLLYFNLSWDVIPIAGRRDSIAGACSLFLSSKEARFQVHWTAYEEAAMNLLSGMTIVREAQQ